MDDGSMPPHVLVMNDTPEILDLLCELLEEEGFRVSTSLYVLDLAKIKTLNPDVIVLDVMFEGHDKGWQFLTLARLDPEVCAIPLLLCTAAVQTVKPMQEHLASVGVSVVLKPFDINHLLWAINQALSGREVALEGSSDRLADGWETNVELRPALGTALPSILGRNPRAQ
ncbi:MAG: response regulator [Chloroflexota bacterium]|nr:response regulator [Chloroflexota bacterium]MDP9471527.1 response regulator [Chloroflexota bacterium]